MQSSAPGGGFVERAGEVLRDLRKDIEEATEAPAEEEGTSPLEPEAVEPEPIPVQIRQPDPTPLQLLQTIVGPLIPAAINHDTCAQARFVTEVTRAGFSTKSFQAWQQASTIAR